MTLDMEKLTAYVLGELDDAERKAVEEFIMGDEAAQEAVAELRATAAFAREAFATAEAPALSPESRERITETARTVTTRRPLWKRAPVRRWVSIAVAAGFIVLIIGSSNVLSHLRASRELVAVRTEERQYLSRKSVPRVENRLEDTEELSTDKENPPSTTPLPDKSVKSKYGRDLVHFGKLYEENGNNSRAREFYKEALQIDPTNKAAAEGAKRTNAPAVMPMTSQDKLNEDRVLVRSRVESLKQLPESASRTDLNNPAGTELPADTAVHNLPTEAEMKELREKRNLQGPSELAEVTVGGSLQTRDYYYQEAKGVSKAEPAKTDKDGDGLGGRPELSFGTPWLFGKQGEPPAPPAFNDPNKVYWPGHNTEAYDKITDNPFKDVTQEPLSTFSIDMDTASYSNVRRFLTQGSMPPPDSVRIEELLNYFDYDYAPPADKSIPFASHIEVSACPWAPEHRLARVALKGWEMAANERPASNLVFLIDVSGSMQPENKLPLLKEALQMLVRQLDERDRIAMVVYAGSSGLVLPSTPGNEQAKILGAIDQLESGGSTHGSAGIQLAYETAIQNFLPGATNRVLLCTDGDFNVGVTDEGQLTRIIEEKAKSGVFLTVLGFGMGNLKDATLEQLADKGNGNYGYIDTLNEARKVLVQGLSGTLVTIAKDVKIQIEFNPAKVQAYRLIGYENRIMAKEDFNDDTKDAGEIGAGHTVTALYELVPPGASTPGAPNVDPLKYQQPAQPKADTQSDELFTLKLRYKAPDGDTSKFLEYPARDSGATLDPATPDFRFASAVAEFGMILRGSPYKGAATLDTVLDLAEGGIGKDPYGYRSEFLQLVQKAKALAPPAPVE